MREIKFRAWDKNKNVMCSLREFDPCIIVHEGCFYIHQGDGCDFEFMQYTGLKDMIGKEIYEGDIIKSYGIYTNDKTYIVKYEDGGFYPFADSDDGLPYPQSDSCIIIGNIYENKRS